MQNQKWERGGVQKIIGKIMILIQNQKFGGGGGRGVSKFRIFDGLIMTYKNFFLLTPCFLIQPLYSKINIE